jgi:hypothetical protein
MKICVPPFKKMIAFSTKYAFPLLDKRNADHYDDYDGLRYLNCIERYFFKDEGKNRN